MLRYTDRVTSAIARDLSGAPLLFKKENKKIVKS